MKNRPFYYLTGLTSYLLLGFTTPLLTSDQADDTAFSIAVLPDTQFYTAEVNGGKKEMFQAQTTWILENRQKENIQYVAQLGDVVNYGERDTLAWKNAAEAMYALEKPQPGMPYGIPYGMAVGNHDQDPGQRAITGKTSYFNRYFGINHFKSKHWYGGHYRNDNDNHYDLFSAGGMDFLVVYLEYDAFDEDQDSMDNWANSIMEQYKDRKAIVVSHSIIANNRKKGTNEKGFAGFSPQGRRLYDRLKYQPNFFLMLCGHVGQNGEGYRQDFYAGRAVKTLLSDYQGRENGGHGLMRLIRFSKKYDRISVRTFSPYSGEEETDDDSRFTRPLFVNTNANRQFDFNNDGRSDIVGFKDGIWTDKAGSVSFGQAGDIAVPADYNGDGQSERAVFRPSKGLFLIEGRDSVSLGQEGDIPVPADYDGDGYADAAVFRPSDGTWYIKGLKSLKFGGPKGIPVPGDYDGDGKADIAVFNTTRNVLQVYNYGNQPFEGYPANELVPIPADYNGDGRTDFAAFRPATGEWIFEGTGRKVIRLGQHGDIPVEGDYLGKGMAQPAVYRNGKIILADGEKMDSGILQPAVQIVNVPSYLHNFLDKE